SVLASGPTWTFAESGENQDKSVRPSMRLSVNTAEAAIDAALAGAGLTNVLSYQVARHVSEASSRSFCSTTILLQSPSLSFMPARDRCRSRYAAFLKLRRRVFANRSRTTRPR